MTMHNPHKLIVTEGALAGETYPLERDELVIGREPGVDLLIDLPGVSRRHARIFIQNAQYLVEDLGSSNGTFLNGERLEVPRRLKSGDQAAGARRYPGIPGRAAAGRCNHA